MTTTIRFWIFLLLLSCGFDTPSCAFEKEDKYQTLTTRCVKQKGFFDIYWDSSEGKVYLEIVEWNKEFLYVTFLAAGVGSNDIGLDRGMIGDTKVVRFERFGPKVLLMQSNYDFRAESDNIEEQLSVNEAFAQSVIGGFPVIGEQEQKVLIDITDLLVSDVQNVAETLKATDQGSYSLDKGKSVVFHKNLKNFPKNTEMEALLTFSGNPTGSNIWEVTPTPKSVTIRQRHSFVSLPDDKYERRVFDPRSGYINIDFMDYASPIEDDIHKRFITRHRLQKKNPNKKNSKAVEPIIYYVDRGVPEPIRSALIEGASWWNEAFEAAGFIDAFQVKILPEGADPLDVRYNMIQWVHRSTRGWSYGASIKDPRTGEIIKGHVSLGSLRVRQDYLIAQGLLSPFKEDGSSKTKMTEMALARLRQLSAHEVGHTLGLVHNYVASTYVQGSVMDYPHPKIMLDNEGNIDLSEAYDVGIGVWDKVAIKYGYSEFTKKENEQEELESILMESIDKGIAFLSDKDARPIGSSHPRAHLWDNGPNAADELNRLMKVRRVALSNFGESNIPYGAPLASLEDVLVPIYFLHRYQTEATVKIIGGLEYNYAVRGNGTFATKTIAHEEQQKALDAILGTLQPSELALDESIIRLIPPKPLGYRRGRENVQTHTGITFDPLAFAETSARMTLAMLLDAQRCARLVELHVRNSNQLSLEIVLNQILNAIQEAVPESDLEKEIKFIIEDVFFEEIIELAQGEYSSPSVKAITSAFLVKQAKLMHRDEKGIYLQLKISKFLESPEPIKPSKNLKPPDGSPIGSGVWRRGFHNLQCTSIH